MIVVSLPKQAPEPKKKKKSLWQRGKVLLFVSLVALALLIVIPITLDKYLATPNTETAQPESATTKSLDIGSLFDRGSNIIDSVLEPELKHDNNITSVLIVGIDTRNVSFQNGEFVSTHPEGQAGTRNTDTIIQAVYDHANEQITLISIPRDLGVDVSLPCLEFHGSIHWVYDKAQSKGCPGGGQQVLVDTVEGITGIQIQYYGFVTLEAFTEIIDTIGVEQGGKKGIYVNNPEQLWEVYPYGDTGWESVYFPQGDIFLSSEDALKYARSRQVTTDFGRARRQQIVIEAVKDRILTTETLLNPQKIMGLIQIFSSKTLFTQPTLEEIRASLDIIQNFNDKEITNIVLDPELGGHENYLNKQPHDRPGGPYYMVPTAWASCPEDNRFCEVQEFIARVMEQPELYNSDANIFVYGRGYKNGKTNLDNSVYQDFKSANYPLNLAESKYTAGTSIGGDILIFDYSNGEYKDVLDFLSLKLDTKILPGDKAPGLNINKEDITIVIQGY
ncbi:LCP family protein [Candidatus Dojkabacteria bacterium]|uniref:LCP family protein n=1 Tax=Candidatus Dojkabacteria bacterium TaxID=2099670 RepID=A0A955L4I7_9BACT|nr:LCP family protein [Candidatus Dojkabacteria bacterium]